MPAPPPLPAGARLPTRLDGPASSPHIEELDAGWLDDLFPGEGGEAPGDEEDPDAEEKGEEEPLPDEQLDPAAFALAKAAREERAELRRARRKAKAEAKRARQRARAEELRAKQKKKRPRPASPERSDAEPAPRPASIRPSSSERRPASAAPRERAGRSGPPQRRPSTAASVRLLAIVLGVLLALAALVAALAR